MRRDRFVICTLGLLVAVAGACVDKGPGKTQKHIDPAYIESNLLTEAPPTMGNAVNADFGGKVVYLGNDVESDTLVPGEATRIVHYWKVVEAPGSDWRVFTHAEANTQKDEWMNLDYTDMRQGYGPAEWKAGDIIRDEQEVRLKKPWASPHARLLVGLFRKGGRTVSDRMPVVSGPAAKDSAVLAFTFKVQRSKPAAARTSEPGYIIRRAGAPITIDGKADEDDWKRAGSSPAFAEAEGSPRINGATTGRMLWDDQFLYLFVTATDTDVHSEYTSHDDPLWKQDVIEMFIDADRNRRGYVELQINPNNAQFDSWFATSRSGKAAPEWNANMKSAVIVRGTADQRTDTDVGWDVEVAIPLEAVKGQDPGMRVALPPRIGDRWRLNVVRVDLPKGKKSPAVSSWNQITYQDFHALNRMLEVQFADETGSTKPAARSTISTPGQPAGGETGAGDQPGGKPGDDSSAHEPSPGTAPDPGAKPAEKPAAKPVKSAPAKPVKPAAAKPVESAPAKPAKPATSDVPDKTAPGFAPEIPKKPEAPM